MEEVYVIGSTDVPELVNCTACNKGLRTIKRKIFKHPRLDVLLCRRCLKFLSTNDFTKDEDGIEEYCTWCGDGGNLVCCDFCEKAYCKHCVKRNLGKEFLKALLSAEDSKWKCFCCDNGQILSFVDECKSIMEHVKSLPSSEGGAASSEGAFKPPNTTAKEPVKSNNNSTNLKSNNSHKSASKKVSNGLSGSTSSLTSDQLERRKRLQEVTKQVENVSSERVGFKSSFVRYEISDDDDDDSSAAAGDTSSAIGQNNNSDEIDSKNISLYQHLNSSVGNSTQGTGMDKPPNLAQVPVIDKPIDKVSTSSSSINVTNGSSKLMQDSVSKHKSLSSVLDRLGDASEVSMNSDQTLDNDDKDTEKVVKSAKEDVEEEASIKKKIDSTEITSSEKKVNFSGEKSDGKEEETSKRSETSKKKKQTILMISSSSEGSDEEIVLMSKSGKRKVISKSLLKLALAAMESKEPKKSKKDEKSPKKEKKNMETSVKKKKQVSDSSSSSSSSSEDEMSSSDDSDSSDDEPLISKVKSKNLTVVQAKY